MGFTQPCFIRKNTKELREYLRNIGYKSIVASEYPNLGCDDGWINDSPTCDHDGIDCGTNEELFKAIAALRDETDENQWFVKDGLWILCDREDWDDCVSDLSVGKRFENNADRSKWLDYLESFRKATVEELINHFK